jgi:hypothetical protein
MKMQIAFRSTSDHRYNHDVVMAVGIVEVGPEDPRDYDEKCQAFRFDFQDNGYPRVVGPVAEPREIIGEYGYSIELETGTLEGLLTTQIERAVPNEYINADFILRLTELPASVEEGRVYAFAGMLHVKPGQRFVDKHLLWFESSHGASDEEMTFVGRSGIERRPETGEIDMTADMVGQAITAYLREPLWGFGEEAYGLPGTMRIAMYHYLARYQELVLNESLDPAEEEELAALRPIMRDAGLDALERDPQYRALVQEMRSLYPEFSANFPMTAEQIVSRQDSLKVLVSSILGREEGRVCAL